MPHKFLCTGVFLLMAAAAGAATYSPSYTILDSIAKYDVKADGSFVEDVIEDLRLNNQAGVDDLSQYSIQFSTALQSVEVLDAWTETRDGKKLQVSRENILLQQAAGSANAPMFDDSKVVNVVFPALAPGVKIHIHFQRKQQVAEFPGVFALEEHYSRNEDRDSTDLIINAPTSMHLQVEALQVPGGEEASGKAGVSTWHWHLGRNAAEAPESDAISEVDYSPRIAVSTMNGYDELAQAYLSRANPKAAVTPYIRQLADQITSGTTDPKAQAELLYRWVSKNIRYVAIYFGVGGVVPHEADLVAHALYGDCKDHVTLYQALLAAKGIKSSPVLVNAEQSWWLSRVAVPTGAFNHAITYLPQWNLFVDTTAQFAPFGVLPDVESGKTALVTDDGSGKPKLMALPNSDPKTDRISITSEMKLMSDGSIKGSSDVHHQGVYDVMARSAFSEVTPGTEGEAASKLLSARGLQGSGSLTLSNVYDLTHPFGYQSAFELPDFVDLTGPTAVVVPSGEDSIVGLAAFASWGGEMTARRYPTMLDSGYCEENATLKLPAGVEVLALPRPVSIDTPLGHYEASYKREGNAVHIHRVLVLNDTSPVLSPERYPLLRKLARFVAHDLRAQILLQPTATFLAQAQTH